MAFLCRDIAHLQTDLHIDGNLQQLRLPPQPEKRKAISQADGV